MTAQEAKNIKPGDTIVDRNGAEYTVRSVAHIIGVGVKYFESTGGKLIEPWEVNNVIRSKS